MLFFCDKTLPGTPYDSREEVGKRFRERAKPLVEQTRDLWQRIQRIEDPVTRTLKELAYMQLFRPMWEEAVNEQFYIDHPHLRPDPEAERRKLQEKLAQKPQVLLQTAYEMVRGQPWNENTPIVPKNLQRSGNMQVIPTLNQQNGLAPVALDEGEMKTLHEWTVRNSLYGDSPKIPPKK